MSEVIRALREAEDSLTYLGLDPSEAHRDGLTKHMLEITFASILEFGSDSMHPSAVDTDTEYEISMTDEETFEEKFAWGMLVTTLTQAQLEVDGRSLFDIFEMSMQPETSRKAARLMRNARTALGLELDENGEVRFMEGRGLDNIDPIVQQQAMIIFQRQSEELREAEQSPVIRFDQGEQ